MPMSWQVVRMGTSSTQQEIVMKKMILKYWQAWYEARINYANRFLQHRLGS